MPNNCPQLHQELETIKTLKQEFNSALDGAVKTGNLGKAEKLKEELENKIFSLREKLHISVDKAKEIMGKDAVFGPKETGKAFGFLPENVPPIPFKKEDLERAKSFETENFKIRLIYYPDKNSEGEPFDVKTIAKLSSSNTAQNGEKLLYKDQFNDNMDIESRAWFSNDKKILNEKILSGWQLVSEEILDNTTSKNYKDQTEELIKKYEEVYPDNPPSDWENLKSDFRKLPNEAVELAGHRLSQMLREPYSNTIFRYLLIEKLTGRKILKDKRSWSNTASSGGALVDFGSAVADGAAVGRTFPGYEWSDFGAVFSRSEYLKIGD